MAQSLIGGLVANGHPAGDIIVADLSDTATSTAAERFGVLIADDNSQAFDLAESIVLAVKPQHIKTVLSDAASKLDSQLLISIAAGILSQDMLSWAQADQNNIAVVRCMPNTPALLQCGATGLYADDRVTLVQRQVAEDILKSVGATTWVTEEKQLDAITALSGSGPAYFFLMIEAMTDAAVTLGLDKDVATEFAIQTALGAARMASEGEPDPATLRKNVTSPAGTTEAALKDFNQNNFKQIVQTAMQAANDRALALGKELGDSNG